MRKAWVSIGGGLIALLAGCGGDSSAPTVSEGDVRIAPEMIVVPDPCTLLTPDEAFALLTTATQAQYAAEYGSADFSAVLKPNGYTNAPQCEWGNGSVQLSVSVIQPGGLDAETEATLLRATQQAYLDNWTGRPMAGVGDGAEVGGSTPVAIDALKGRWIIHLAAYVKEDSDERFAQAARAVLARLDAD